jgi:hypothetical protein
MIRSKIMWIVSGPTCVGKSYFLWNKKDRLSEITNLPSFEGGVEAGAFKAIDCDEIYESRKKNICVHMEVLGVKGQQEQGAAYHTKWEWLSELKTRKSVIILGVPYSEYKVRVIRRDGIISENNRRDGTYYRKKGPRLQSHTQILELYKNWIGELNKKEIPYFLVESFGDYKILEEEDFFRMLK